MKKDNFYKTLRIICLILAIVCMALSLFKKAKAESLPNYVIDYIENDDVLQTLKNTNSSVLDAYNRALNFGYYLKSEGNRFNSRQIYYIFTDYDKLRFGTTTSSSSYYAYPAYVFNSSDTIYAENNQGFTLHMIAFSCYNDGNGNYRLNFVRESYYTFNIGSHVNNSWNTNLIYNYTTQYTNPEYNYPRSSQGCIAYGEFYGLNGSSTNSGIAFKVEEFEAPPTTNTTGFNVFKYNNLGTDTLRIVPPQNQVPVGTHSSNISTVTFDLVIDSTTIPCEYNSESEYYFESLEYGRAYYEIPLSSLLPSSLNDFDEVYVTNVNYVNTWSNQGGESGTNTFIYVDKCYLKRSVGNDDVGQVTITHIDTNTGYTDTEINNINTMITNASTLQGSFDVEKNLSGGSTTPFSFSSFQDAVVREIECWHPTGTKDSDWLSITIDNITYDSGDNMYWLEYDSNSSQSFEHRYNYNVSPYSYVRENNYSGYYDIIYFIVHEQVYDSSGSGFSTLDQTYTRYYYFISDRYYNKLILYREMDILTYIKLNNEIGEKTYNYLFDRLLNIDDNLYYYIKDKAVIDNDILDALEDIDNDMQFNLDIINDLLSKILDALLNLNIEVPEADYTDILEKLDTIIENQDTSDINDDWYQNYREWLYGINENDSYLSPHEYFNNIFGTLKTTFDSFTNNISFNAYLLKVEDFINHISGNTTDNITIYLRDGIGDPGFNINNNYMYTVGGS